MNTKKCFNDYCNNGDVKLKVCSGFCKSLKHFYYCSEICRIYFSRI